MKKIRIGIIGAGQNTCAIHIPNFLKIPHVVITHVCNRSVLSSKKVAEQFNIPNIEEKWQAIIENSDIDAVLIGTWPYMHCPITLAALKNGKHVLCEARMAMNLSEAIIMLQTSRVCWNLVAQLVPASLSFSVDNTIKEILLNDILGEILHVEIKHNNSGFFKSDDFLHWRQDFWKSGYNILTMGIWYECMMRWLGEADDVFANGCVEKKLKYDNEAKSLVPVIIPDHIDVIANLKCGATAYFQFSNMIEKNNDNGVCVYGNKASLFFEYSSQKLYIRDRFKVATEEYSVPSKNKVEWTVERDFINSILNKEPVKLTKFEDGVKYMAFTESVFSSLEKRKLIKIKHHF